MMSPEPLLQMSMSYAHSRVLSAGVQLNIFSHIAAGNKTVKDIAHAAKASQRGISMLLDAMVAFQILTKSHGQYSLTPLSERYLVRESPDYVGAMMEDDRLWLSWGHLVEVIRTGHSPFKVEHQSEAEQFFPVLIRTLHVMNAEPAKRVAHAIGAGKTRSGLHVLDVACGSGVWSIAVAEADKEARLTMQDFPGVLDHTREYLRRHDVADRCNFLPGDLKQVDFAENRFDVALLGNIVHSEGEESSRDLFKRLHRALKQDGQICITDMIPNDERTGPPFALIFALNMLINTEEGGTYTLAEYTQWLNDAGFSRVETADIGSHSPLIVGIKD